MYLRENCYKEFQYYKKPKLSVEADCDQIQSQIHCNLSVAVQRALVADVPVGLSLSGGIDSCAIAAIAKKNSIKSLNVFQSVIKVV